MFFKDKKKLSFSLLGTAGFLVLSLYGFSFLLQKFVPSLEISLSWFWYFLLYCGLLFLFLILLHKQRRNVQIWFLFLVWFVMFAVVGFLGFQVGLQAVMLLVMSAYAEEFLKIGVAKNNLKKSDFFSSDILFLSVLAALGFSIVENIFYLGQQVIGGEGGVVALLFGRGIFSSLIHLIATGTIALLLYKLYQNVKFQQLASWKRVYRVVVCMLAGVALHLGYNLAVGAAQFWVYIVVVIGGYFLLSYVLFLSDSLYRE